jgi:hypothetical protein
LRDGLDVEVLIGMSLDTGSLLARGARFLFVLGVGCFVMSAIAADREGRIDVVVHGSVKTAARAIGGETTGVTITADGITWELELQEKQAKAAAALDGRMAVVSGRLVRRTGVERAERHVVKVRSIVPAPP